MTETAKARLWVKIILPGVGQIGAGKIELLQRIDEHQSMAAAARSMSMSYRRAWLLVDELNGLFKQPVVAKWQGGKSQGGASLTPFGRKLIESYGDLVRRAHEVNRETLQFLGDEAAENTGDEAAAGQTQPE